MRGELSRSQQLYTRGSESDSFHMRVRRKGKRKKDIQYSSVKEEGRHRVLENIQNIQYLAMGEMHGASGKIFRKFDN